MGIKDFFGLNGNDGNDQDINESGDDQYYTKPVEGEGTGITNTATNKMMLLEPRAYSESQQIADYLKKRNAVVVNLKRVTPDQAKRIVDFLSGTLYAIGGDLQKLGGGIFLCTPNNVNVEGKITDGDKEKSSSKATMTQTKKDKDEEEFNW